MGTLCESSISLRQYTGNLDSRGVWLRKSKILFIPDHSPANSSVAKLRFCTHEAEFGQISDFLSDFLSDSLTSFD